LLPDGRAGRVDGGDPLADLSPRLTSRIELAVVEYVGWFNHSRASESRVRSSLCDRSKCTTFAAI
jgi:hypothetical protein